MYFVLILQKHPIRMLYIVHKMFWLDSVRMWIRNSYSSVMPITPGAAPRSWGSYSSFICLVFLLSICTVHVFTYRSSHWVKFYWRRKQDSREKLLIDLLQVTEKLCHIKAVSNTLSYRGNQARNSSLLVNILLTLC